MSSSQQDLILDLYHCFFFPEGAPTQLEWGEPPGRSVGCFGKRYQWEYFLGVIVTLSRVKWNRLRRATRTTVVLAALPSHPGSMKPGVGEE